MDVVTACKDQWNKTADECNQYAAAVAAQMRVFLPGAASDANWITQLVSGWVTLGPGFAVPAGHLAASRAIAASNAGHFVLAAMTADEINAAHEVADAAARRVPKKKTAHGHVAVVVPGVGRTGWPLGFWKSHQDGRGGGQNASLSLAFPSNAPDKVHYFVVTLPGRKDRLL